MLLLFDLYHINHHFGMQELINMQYYQVKYVHVSIRLNIRCILFIFCEVKYFRPTHQLHYNLYMERVPSVITEKGTAITSPPIYTFLVESTQRRL